MRLVHWSVSITSIVFGDLMSKIIRSITRQTFDSVNFTCVVDLKAGFVLDDRGINPYNGCSHPREPRCDAFRTHCIYHVMNAVGMECVTTGLLRMGCRRLNNFNSLMCSTPFVSFIL